MSQAFSISRIALDNHGETSERTVRMQSSYLTILALCLPMLNGCGEGGRFTNVHSSPTPTASTLHHVQWPSAEKAASALIKPGQSVGLLRLGDSHEHAVELLGKTEEDYNFENNKSACARSEMHWADVELDSNGVFLYLKDSRIYQIVAATPRYATREGIKSGDTPGLVRRYYPSIQAFALLGSGSQVVGGRDVIYWVDQQQGIAFEFYYDSKTRKRYLEGIVVFDPEVSFLPEGCISPPQKWVKLKPFSLEHDGGK